MDDILLATMKNLIVKEEKEMDEKLSEKIALFRYGLIAPVIHESGKGQMKYFRMLSQKIYEVLHQGQRIYKISVFKDWLRRYRQGGFNDRNLLFLLLGVISIIWDKYLP